MQSSHQLELLGLYRHSRWQCAFPLTSRILFVLNRFAQCLLSWLFDLKTLRQFLEPQIIARSDFATLFAHFDLL